MSKFQKIIVSILVLILLVVGVVFFLARHYLTEDRIKSLIVPSLEKATGLKVSLEGIKRKGFSGIDIERVSFLDPKTAQRVLSTDKILVSLDLWPLLHGKLIVTKLILVHPVLRLVREKDGHLNLERYFQTRPEAEKHRPEGPSGPQKEASSTRTARWSLIFQHLAVKQAEFSFEDARGELPPLSMNFSLAGSLDFSEGYLAYTGNGVLSSLKVASYPLVKGLKFTTELAPKSLTLKVSDGHLLGGNLSGQIDTDYRTLSGAFSLKGGAFEKAQRLLENLRPYLFPQVHLPRLAGIFDLKGRLQGSFDQPQYTLTLTLSPLSLNQPPYQVVLNGQVSVTPDVLKPVLAVTVNHQNIELNGKIFDWQTRVPRVDLRLKTARLDLKALTPPTQGKKQKEKKGPTPSPKTTKPSRAVFIPRLPVKGQVKLKAQELCYQLCVQDLDAQVNLTPKTINSLAEFRLAQGDIQLSAQVKGLGQLPQTYFTFEVAGLDLSTLLKSWSPKKAYVTSGTLWSSGAFRTKGLTVEALEQNLRGKGEAQFVKLGLKEIPAALIAADLLGVPDLAHLSFDQGHLLFTTQEGQLFLDGQFSRPGLNLLLKGKVAFAGTLDLKPVLVFAEPYASQIRRRLPGANLLVNRGRLEVPLEVKGPFFRPKVRLRLTSKVKQKLEEKVKEKLLEFLR